MSASNNRTSVLIPSQVPQFIRDQYENFVSFVQVYYKWLESSGNLLDVSKKWQAMLDIDILTEIVKNNPDVTVFEEILDFYYNDYIKPLPKDLVVDKAFVLKHVKDFYRARGSEKSIKFLLRAMFGQEAEIYYPKLDILKTSDGKWQVDLSLKVKDLVVGFYNANTGLILDSTGNVATPSSDTSLIYQFAGRRIHGETSNASATVESINYTYVNNNQVAELILSDIIRTFINGEEIYTDLIYEGNINRLAANLYSGTVDSVTIITPGEGYEVGAMIPLLSNTGSGGVITISSVTSGGIRSVGITDGGVGFMPGDSILITGRGGFGATANVLTTDTSEKYHPNTYNLCSLTIGQIANTTIGGPYDANLNFGNANIALQNLLPFFTISGLGPIATACTTAKGSGYTSSPTPSGVANAALHTLGILGRMEIHNGGLGYAVNDSITFVNVVGGYGAGAQGQVTNVAANGMIHTVAFTQQPGWFVGGSGYSQSFLPNLVIHSANGTNANVSVVAILGESDVLFTYTDIIGAIQGLQIQNGGINYKSPPILDFANVSPGLGAVGTTSITEGIFTYPGRFINDNGMLSANKFLEGPDYYQNYSYEVKVGTPFNSYETTLKRLTHPAGTKMFGKFLFLESGTIDLEVNTQNTIVSQLTKSTYSLDGYITANYAPQIISGKYNVAIVSAGWYTPLTFANGTYYASGANVWITSNNHGYVPGSNVFVSFSNYPPNVNTTNVISRNWSVLQSTQNTFLIGGNTSVFPPFSGNVKTMSPGVIFSSPGHGLRQDDKVYITFQTSNTAFANGYYYVRSTNPTQFGIELPNVGFANANAFTGNATVFTPGLTITANDHGYSVGQNAYLVFTSGDLANTTNGSYVTEQLITSNSFNVSSTNIATSNGNVLVYTQNVKITTSANNGFSNSSNIFTYFMTGDLTNAVNEIYSINTINANSFVITLSENPVIANGIARVFDANLTYDNVDVTYINSRFTVNTSIMTLFDSSTISNGVYKLANTVNSNTFILTGAGVTLNASSIISGNVFVGKTT